MTQAKRPPAKPGRFSDADLDGGQEAARFGGERERGLRPRLPDLGHGAQTGPPGGNHGQFRQGEHAVQGDKDEHDGEFEQGVPPSGVRVGLVAVGRVREPARAIGLGTSSAADAGRVDLAWVRTGGGGRR